MHCCHTEQTIFYIFLKYILVVPTILYDATLLHALNKLLVSLI